MWSGGPGWDKGTHLADQCRVNNDPDDSEAKQLSIYKQGTQS